MEQCYYCNSIFVNFSFFYTQTHLPSYIEAYDELRDKGIEKVACVTVNDAFVTQAWADQLGVGEKVTISSIDIYIFNNNNNNNNQLGYIAS